MYPCPRSRRFATLYLRVCVCIHVSLCIHVHITAYAIASACVRMWNIHPNPHPPTHTGTIFSTAPRSIAPMVACTRSSFLCPSPGTRRASLTFLLNRSILVSSTGIQRYSRALSRCCLGCGRLPLRATIGLLRFSVVCLTPYYASPQCSLLPAALWTLILRNTQAV